MLNKFSEKFIFDIILRSYFLLYLILLNKKSTPIFGYLGTGVPVDLDKIRQHYIKETSKNWMVASQYI
jgi:hypothetical protein